MQTDESTWVRLVAEALDKHKGPCSATAISNSLKPARRTPSARKQILRILQRHVCFILVVKGVPKIRESTWALHKAWREHALLGRTSVEGRVESVSREDFFSLRRAQLTQLSSLEALVRLCEALE